MTDYVVAHPHPHRTGAAVFEILYDPAPGWAKRAPYRGRDVKAVALRPDETAPDVVELKAMHEAAPGKTLAQLVDGWRWNRELYHRALKEATDG